MRAQKLLCTAGIHSTISFINLEDQFFALSDLQERGRCRIHRLHCSHEALPFVEASAKTKLAGSVETQPCHHLAAL
jgi:hypothetical protein